MSIVVNRGVLAAAVCLLSACAGTGRHRLQDPVVAAAYGHGDSVRNIPIDPVRLGETRAVRDTTEDVWWQGFGDERLNRLVSQALQVNTDLASAGFRLKNARLAAGLAADSLFPQVDASVSTGYSKLLSGDSPGARSHGVNGSVSYQVDLWGRLRAQRDIAKWEAQATEEDLQSTFLALVADTCNLYWTLAYLNQRITAGEESLARVAKTLDFIRAQYNAGAVSRLEVREAEQSLRSQESSHSQLLQQRVELRNALTVLLDGQPWPQADEPQNLDGARSADIQPGLPAELLSRRPDLRAAELRLRQSLRQVKVARTGYYPAISLTGSVGGSSTALSDVLANPVASLGAGLSLPFLHWNQAKLNTAIAGTQYEMAANDFRRTLYGAFAEVDNALSAREQLVREVELSRLSFEAAVEVERLYEVRYRAGATPLRSWLDAQETRRSAELALSQARLTQLQNDLDLLQALGGSAQLNDSGSTRTFEEGGSAPTIGNSGGA